MNGVVKPVSITPIKQFSFHFTQDPSMRVRVWLENATAPQQGSKERLRVRCEALGSRPIPKLRLALGGEPLQEKGENKRTFSGGELSFHHDQWDRVS